MKECNMDDIQDYDEDDLEEMNKEEENGTLKIKEEDILLDNNYKNLELKETPQGVFRDYVKLTKEQIDKLIEDGWKEIK